MSPLADRILKEFQSHDPRDQVVLLDRLIASVPKDDNHLSPEWHAELCRRIEDVDAGNVQVIDSDKVMDGLDKRLEA